jgi:hypothetical protein
MSAHAITPERLGELEQLLSSDLTFEEWLTEEDMAALLTVANAHEDLVSALRKARNIILQMGLPDEATDRVLLESGNAIDKAEGRS